MNGGDFEREQGHHGEVPRRLRPGLYYGIVEDTQDPEKRNRVRVRVYPDQCEFDAQGKPLGALSTSMPTSSLAWAQVLGGFGGLDDEGVHYTPSVGAQVVVGFIQNDPSYPVVLGAAYPAPKGVPTIPTEAKNAAIDPRKVFVTVKTPTGFVISIDENENERKLTIETGYGVKHRMVFNDLLGFVEIVTHDGNEVRLDDGKGRIEVRTCGVRNASNPGKKFEAVFDDAEERFELRTPRGYIARVSDKLAPFPVVEPLGQPVMLPFEGLYLRTPLGQQSLVLSQDLGIFRYEDWTDPVAPTFLRCERPAILAPLQTSSVSLGIGYTPVGQQIKVGSHIEVTATKIRLQSPRFEFAGGNPPTNMGIPTELFQPSGQDGVYIQGPWVIVHGITGVRLSTADYPNNTPPQSGETDYGEVGFNRNTAGDVNGPRRVGVNRHKHGSNGTSPPQDNSE